MSTTDDASCRQGCAACCIAISISSPIPGMPRGKPAGERCVNLDDDRRCLIHSTPEYPAVCAAFRPSREMCGESDSHAFAWLAELERLTAPGDTPIDTESSRTRGK